MKLSRVHPLEWLTGLLGLAMLAGLFMPWNGDTAALASPGPVDIFVLVAAIAAAFVPVAVAFSVRTNVPIVYETLLWIFSGLVVLILVVKAVFPPDGGFETGFWLAFGGTVAMCFTVWRCMAREE